MNNIKTQGGEDEFRELDQVCMCHQGHLALGSCGVTGGDGLNVEKRQGTGNTISWPTNVIQPKCIPHELSLDYHITFT